MILQNVTIEKLVHGGQGLATDATGKKIFVWNALPGEVVIARVIKNKRNYSEAIAEQIIQPSKYRVQAREENYLATSPWQILQDTQEDQQKLAITKAVFASEKVSIPADVGITAGAERWQYRNKMEYSFWGDDNGIHLALHRRGSHAKQIVSGSQLALPAVDAGARALLSALSPTVRAGDLKTVVVRCDQRGNTVAALFVKQERFPKLVLPAGLQGLRVYYSNPKSPASVPTKLLHDLGECNLQDTINGSVFTYDVDSFFQVNIPIYEQALSDMALHVASQPIVDMYAGVGTIGLSLVKNKNTVKLIELDAASVAMAQKNAESIAGAQVIQSSTEKALEYIAAGSVIIFDPPRAGLHKNVISRVLDEQPAKIMYLSCNPATQARDIALLGDAYNITDMKVYNFFPQTPHIENLCILELA